MAVRCTLSRAVAPRGRSWRMPLEGRLGSPARRQAADPTLRAVMREASVRKDREDATVDRIGWWEEEESRRRKAMAAGRRLGGW